MRKLGLVFLWGAAGLLAHQPAARPAHPAPPDVDQALRARIQKFYQAHVDGKFRVASQLVAEESQDHFLEMQKGKILGFRITGIEYSENFTHAQATVDCEREMKMVGFGQIFKMTMPVVSTWKLADGDWWWYHDPNAVVQTPFGAWSSKQSPNAAAKPEDASKGPRIEEVQAGVKADKAEVELRGGAADQVTITNHMPGWVSLSVQVPRVPGLEAKLDRAQVPKSESAQLSLRYQPQEKAPGPPLVVINILVDTTNQVIPIRVRLAPRPPAR